METNSPLYAQIAIVVFREILEISLILGILASATTNIKGRTKWIMIGLLSGLGLSIILAMLTDKISQSLNGSGQEIFNGTIMLSACAMLGWTVIWMQKQGKVISGELKQLSQNVREGSKPLYALAFVVLLSVLREGAEIVLFCYSYFVSGSSVFSILAGLIIGTSSGSLIGFALYFGLMRSFGRYFFSVTSWLLIFFAAGTCASAMRFFIAAELISPIREPLFDISNLLSQSSSFGKIFHGLLGYSDRPSALEFITYILVLSTLIFLMKLNKKNSSIPKPSQA
jgi:high-affinity iron transporter